MQHERRIRRAITGLALIASLLVLAAVALVQALGWYRFVPVLSGSMSPFIDTGDVAVLQPMEVSALTVGDVIAFEAPIGDQSLMLHRVSEVVSSTPDLRVRTKGDANSSEDPWTATLDDDVVWRATGQIPALGQPVVFAHRVGTPTIVMMAGGLLLFGAVMRRLWVVEPELAKDLDGQHPCPCRAGGALHHRASAQPAESIVTMLVVAAVAIAGIGLIVARPVRASFTTAAGEEQRLTFRSTTTSTSTPTTTTPTTTTPTTTTPTTTTPTTTTTTAPPDPATLPPPTELVATIICDVVGTPTGIQLDWVRPSPTVDFVVIERSSTPLLGDPEPFIVLAQVKGTTRSFTDDFATVDPPPSNPLDVRYRARSTSESGEFSSYSNVAEVEPCPPSL